MEDYVDAAMWMRPCGAGETDCMPANVSYSSTAPPARTLTLTCPYYGAELRTFPALRVAYMRTRSVPTLVQRALGFPPACNTTNIAVHIIVD